MSKAKFKHDCDNCEFIGHYFNHDVYICRHECTMFPGSIIARHGNEGYEYGSCPIDILTKHWQDRVNKIELGDDLGSMVYQDYLFSEYVCPYTKAMVLALAVWGLKQNYLEN